MYGEGWDSTWSMIKPNLICICWSASTLQNIKVLVAHFGSDVSGRQKLGSGRVLKFFSGLGSDCQVLGFWNGT